MPRVFSFINESIKTRGTLWITMAVRHRNKLVTFLNTSRILGWQFCHTGLSTPTKWEYYSYCYIKEQQWTELCTSVTRGRQAGDQPLAPTQRRCQNDSTLGSLYWRSRNQVHRHHETAGAAPAAIGAGRWWQSNSSQGFWAPRADKAFSAPQGFAQGAHLPSYASVMYNKGYHR